MHAPHHLIRVPRTSHLDLLGRTRTRTHRARAGCGEVKGRRPLSAQQRGDLQRRSVTSPAELLGEKTLESRLPGIL